MSRSGYSEDLDNWDLIKWRGQVTSAIRGQRGQKFLRDMLAAFEALPTKRLIANDIVSPEGEGCAMGALAVARGIDVARVDAEEPEAVAALFDIAHQLAQEVAYENDEGGWHETPEQRYARMKTWILSNIKREAKTDTTTTKY